MTDTPGDMAAKLEAFVENARAGIDFFDRIKDLPADERIAVGTDHWDWIEKIARRAADLSPAAASMLRDMSEREKALRTEVARLSKPEWFYSAEDPEYSGGDVQDVVDDMDREGVMQVAGAREVWKKWVAIRCLTVDENGDSDDTEAATFDTPEEAEKCWPESFAACRAAKALEGK